MEIIIIALVALILLGVVAALATKLSGNGDDEPTTTDNSSEAKTSGSADCSTCTGEDDSCEQIRMLRDSLKKIEYFDDEELDAFRGTQADAYTDEQAEQFSEVMETLRPQEARAWWHSLRLRGIEVPNQVKDELISIIQDN